MELRAFPVLHAEDVEAVAAFYRRLGFSENVRLNGPDGRVGYVGMSRGAAELAVTSVDSPRTLAGVEPGPGPRGELFVYVEDLDAAVAALRAARATVHRESADMPWGERIAFLADPEGNLVTLAQTGRS
jgi:lactoylglutathione lyase